MLHECFFLIHEEQYIEIKVLFSTKNTYIDKTLTQINQLICLLELYKVIYY